MYDLPRIFWGECRNPSDAVPAWVPYGMYLPVVTCQCHLSNMVSWNLNTPRRGWVTYLVSASSVSGDPFSRCPVIMERSDDLGPPPAFSLGSLTTRRHSYPSITDEDTQVFDDDDDDDDYHDGDDEDEVLSDYYEMIDPPPMWARSSSSATVTRYLCTYHHLS
jgi:hypothetical protein